MASLALTSSAAVMTLFVAAFVPLHTGVETRGLRLEEIHVSLGWLNRWGGNVPLQPLGDWVTFTSSAPARVRQCGSHGARNATSPALAA